MAEVQGRVREVAVALDDGLEKLLRGTLKRAIQGFAYALATVALLAGCLLLATSTFLVLRAMIVPRVTEHVKELHFDYRKEHPEAMASFLDEKFLLNTSHTRPGTSVSARFLPAKQKFDLVVEMKLPESEQNLQLGMFQVTAELLTMDNTTIIASASRPAIIQYRSRLVQLGRTVLFLPFLVVDWYTEAQKLHLTMFRNIADTKSVPFATLRVLMQPRAGVAAVPQVYNAKAMVVLRLGTVAGILNRWKWTSSLYGIVILYGTFICTAGSYLLLTMLRKKPPLNQVSSPFQEGRQRAQARRSQGTQERSAELELERILEGEELAKDEDRGNMDETTSVADSGTNSEGSELGDFSELRRRIVQDRSDAY
eukprot:scaffold116_cov334-Pavlova_lutheri.AAC.22